MAAVLVVSSPARAEETLPVHGSISTRYKFQAAGSQRDHDLETLLSIETPISDGTLWHAALQGGGHFDLDGTGPASPFRDGYDAFASRSVGRLYYAYAERRELGPVKTLRLGRQTRYEFESLFYDGVTIESKTEGVLGTVLYGGVPVHPFENQIGFDPGDWLVGAALTVDPHPGLRSRFDYVHVRDRANPVRAASGDLADDLFGGSLWWEAARWASLSGRLTALSDGVRDLRLGALLRPEGTGFRLKVDYYGLLRAYGVRALDLDAYGFIGRYEPFNEFSVKATKFFGERYAADLGFQLRALYDTQVAGAFNHGHERAYIGFSTYDVFLEGLSLNATLDYWRGEDNVLRNNTFAGSFSAAQELFDRKLRLDGGTAYYLYRYNLLAGNESNDVQTYFARAAWKVVRQLEARLGYEYEQNDTDGFHTLDTRVTWKF